MEVSAGLAPQCWWGQFNTTTAWSRTSIYTLNSRVVLGHWELPARHNPNADFKPLHFSRVSQKSCVAKWPHSRWPRKQRTLQ